MDCLPAAPGFNLCFRATDCVHHGYYVFFSKRKGARQSRLLRALNLNVNFEKIIPLLRCKKFPRSSCKSITLFATNSTAAVDEKLEFLWLILRRRLQITDGAIFQL